jgi:hypothetical protein
MTTGNMFTGLFHACLTEDKLAVRQRFVVCQFSQVLLVEVAPKPGTVEWTLGGGDVRDIPKGLDPKFHT